MSWSFLIFLLKISSEGVRSHSNIFHKPIQYCDCTFFNNSCIVHSNITETDLYRLHTWIRLQWQCLQCVLLMMNKMYWINECLEAFLLWCLLSHQITTQGAEWVRVCRIIIRIICYTRWLGAGSMFLLHITINTFDSFHLQNNLLFKMTSNRT